MLYKILIANRGEIACRIIKTAKKMGIQTVAIYSKIDANSLHVKLADSAFCVGEAEAKDSYLNIDKIITIAKENQVDAIHPGYGFLSENPKFAKACEKANIIFIGPSVESMEIMASKQLAKQTLEKTKVPLTPGYHGTDQSDATLFKEAQKLGFPVLLKAANGGGGKGMKVVNIAKDFQSTLDSARREAMASFADDTMLIEKLIEKPRHIEIQIIADKYQNIFHLFERDCSIQRRHQKIIEEARAVNLNEETKKQLAKAAIEVAKTIKYQGVGTIEFLVDKNQNFYFMEMNTRLQVEHPVTEMITGLDLVELQLRVAANEVLKLQQDDIKSRGHAIECRIYAEDPSNDFMPSIGNITHLKYLEEEHVRIDTGITCSSQISQYYDPMLAKVIAWGENREQAIFRLANNLAKYHISGIKTNISFLQTILKNQAFIDNKITTNFLNEEKINIPENNLPLAAQIMACIDYLLLQIKNKDPLKQDTFGFQIHINSHWNREYLIAGIKFSVKLTPISANKAEIEVSSLDKELSLKQCSKNQVEITLDAKENILILNNGTEIIRTEFQRTANKTIIFTDLNAIEITPFNCQSETNTQSNLDNQLTAPMPGTVVAVLKKVNDAIKIGEPLMIMEAMKMEHTITSPSDGIISSIFYDIGSQVKEGATLVAVEKI